MTGFGSVSSTDMKRVLNSISSIDKGLAKEWRKKAKAEVAAPWAAELARQAPAGNKGQAAARSIQTGTGTLPIIYAGKGSTDWGSGGSWQPYFALEFGMSHAKVHTYVRRSPRGNRHVVRRRTGTWAQPHRGRRGYWMWPYWERNEDRLRGRVINLADDFIRSAL